VFNAIFMDFESNGIGYHPIEFFGFYGHQQVVVVYFLFYLIPKFLIVIGVFVHHISIEVIFYFDGAIFRWGDVVLQCAVFLVDEGIEAVCLDVEFNAVVKLSPLQ
ncbi:MAG: hypothetical protein RLZZ47_893, partial [Bacteroidota bacterium]